jgi:hypothetical protein
VHGCPGTSKNGLINSETSETQAAGVSSFERSPFIGVFEIPGSSLGTIGLIGVHLKPTAAVQEANLLDDVYEALEGDPGLPNALLMGDMNLACSYASNTQLQTLDLRVDGRFKWLIPDTADTNVADSVCAYDRIIAVGDGLANIGQGEVDSKTIEHSDHKPVWVIFEGIRIGAFNTKVFGPSKASNTAAMTEIAEIVCSGDIILLQELVSEDLAPINSLLGRVQAECGSGIQMVVSDPTGTTSYKERFAYFYNSTKTNPLEYFLFDQSIQGSDKTVPAPTSTTNVDCGTDPYKTPGGYCYATKDGRKKRVANSCCP